MQKSTSILHLQVDSDDYCIFKAKQGAIILIDSNCRWLGSVSPFLYVCTTYLSLSAVGAGGTLNLYNEHVYCTHTRPPSDLEGKLSELSIARRRTTSTKGQSHKSGYDLQLSLSSVYKDGLVARVCLCMFCARESPPSSLPMATGALPP